MTVAQKPNTPIKDVVKEDKFKNKISKNSIEKLNLILSQSDTNHTSSAVSSKISPKGKTSRLEKKSGKLSQKIDQKGEKSTLETIDEGFDSLEELNNLYVQTSAVL